MNANNELGNYLRKRRGSMSLREFAEICHISHTHLDSLEKGSDPRSGKPVSVSTETLRIIANGIGVDYLFLACLADGGNPCDIGNITIPCDYSPDGGSIHFDLTEDKQSKAPSITDEALKIARQYDALDKYGKKAVKSVLTVETERLTSDEDEDVDNIDYIRHYFTQAAAGYAAPINGEDFELIPRGKDAPKKADYCIEVSGDSMEPYIKDGSRVYVQRTTEIEEFQPGVFFVDGDVFIKQWCADPQGTLYLLSANPEREDANITIRRDSGRSCVCLGKVLISKKLPAPEYW